MLTVQGHGFRSRRVVTGPGPHTFLQTSPSPSTFTVLSFLCAQLEKTDLLVPAPSGFCPAQPVPWGQCAMVPLTLGTLSSRRLKALFSQRLAHYLEHSQHARQGGAIICPAKLNAWRKLPRWQEKVVPLQKLGTDENQGAWVGWRSIRGAEHPGLQSRELRVTRRGY